MRYLEYKIYISRGSLVHDKNIQSWSIVTVGYFLLTGTIYFYISAKASASLALPSVICVHPVVKL